VPPHRAFPAALRLRTRGATLDGRRCGGPPWGGAHGRDGMEEGCAGV
jgi:hypothetical protein